MARYLSMQVATSYTVYNVCLCAHVCIQPPVSVSPANQINSTMWAN